MTVQTTEKQVYEKVILRFDFGPEFEDVTDTIASVDSITYTGASGVLVISAIAHNGVDIVNCLVAGGSDGIRYKVTCKVITTAGQNLELECFLVVRDK